MKEFAFGHINHFSQRLNRFEKGVKYFQTGVISLKGVDIQLKVIRFFFPGDQGATLTCCNLGPKILSKRSVSLILFLVVGTLELIQL